MSKRSSSSPFAHAASSSRESDGNLPKADRQPRETKRRKITRLKIANRNRKEDIVANTNLLSYDEFVAKYIQTDLLTFKGPNSDDCLNIHFSFAADLRPTQLKSCFDLIEATSRSDYESSSFGWHPEQKKDEMSHFEMRYFTVWRSVSPQSSASMETATSETALEGFLSFLVTHEAGLAVVYIYEIHIAESARGQGLGRHLMRLVESVARAIGPKIKATMLTCFVSNVRAINFYRHAGFEVASCSPDAREIRGKVIEPDYMIMSKRLDA